MLALASCTHTNTKDLCTVLHMDIVQGRWELTPVAIEAGKRLSRRLFAGSEELMDYKTVRETTQLILVCVF